MDKWKSNKDVLGFNSISINYTVVVVVVEMPQLPERVVNMLHPSVNY